VKIVDKLREAMKSEFVRRIVEYGFGRVIEIAEKAVAWGYRAARGWASDFDFVRYLTLMDMNKPSLFGIY